MTNYKSYLTLIYVLIFFHSSIPLYGIQTYEDQCPVNVQELRRQRAAKVITKFWKISYLFKTSECGICQDPKCDQMTICRHFFHAQCLNGYKEFLIKSLATEYKCPMCRMTLVTFHKKLGSAAKENSLHRRSGQFLPISSVEHNTFIGPQSI